MVHVDIFVKKMNIHT